MRLHERKMMTPKRFARIRKITILRQTIIKAFSESLHAGTLRFAFLVDFAFERAFAHAHEGIFPLPFEVTTDFKQVFAAHHAINRFFPPVAISPIFPPLAYPFAAFVRLCFLSTT